MKKKEYNLFTIVQRDSSSEWIALEVIAPSHARALQVFKRYISRHYRMKLELPSAYTRIVEGGNMTLPHVKKMKPEAVREVQGFFAVE